MYIVFWWLNIIVINETQALTCTCIVQLQATIFSSPEKNGTKHCLVEGIQIYSNEGPRPFPREDNSEIAKKRNIDEI